MVEGGMSCIKYLLFAFNFLFFLIGLLLIIAGAVIEAYFNKYSDIIEGQFSAVAVLLIILGVIIFIIGFFGCCGAWKENHCMIQTFAALLLIIFILEIAGGIAGFVLRNQVEDVARKGLQESMKQYNETDEKDVWDLLQQDLKCCGVNNYTDWVGRLGHGRLYPKSCCADQSNLGCGSSPDQAYTDGCLKNLQAALSSNLVWIGVIGIVVALIQLIGITFACFLARSVKKEYDVV